MTNGRLWGAKIPVHDILEGDIMGISSAMIMVSELPLSVREAYSEQMGIALPMGRERTEARYPFPYYPGL